MCPAAVAVIRLDARIRVRLQDLTLTYTTPVMMQAFLADLRLVTGVDAADFAAPAYKIVSAMAKGLGTDYGHSRQERVPFRIF